MCISAKIYGTIWYINTKKFGDVIMQYVYAFLVGGMICVVGQILIDKTKLTPARILTGYVVTGVVLSAVGVYGPLADFAGAGASVPLCGFGHVMAQGVKNAVDSIGAMGILKGGLTAGAAGITAAIVFGLLASLVSNSKEK